jgi:hypothetical protein
MIRLLPLLLAACVPVPQDTSSPQDTQPPEPIVAELVLYNAATATGAQGLTVSFPGGDVVTEADGVAAGEIPSGTAFDLLVQGEGWLDHHVFGVAGSEDFQFISYVASQSITNQVLAMLDITWESGTGFLVVGVDYAANLAAVEGATVSLSAAHGEAFVFAGAYPQVGATIPAGGMGFVSFPSVQGSSTTVTVEPPEGVSCEPFPGGGELPDVPVYGDGVTVLAFHCD